MNFVNFYGIYLADFNHAMKYCDQKERKSTLYMNKNKDCMYQENATNYERKQVHHHGNKVLDSFLNFWQVRKNDPFQVKIKV